ncbi:hypothetical protein [Lysobacter niastensis]|uniref:Uncharacterized protein n=1 Tax=Lysobacter niastensis TaxID=380629 RepID=A0ABS0B563_9GAMM|nr:hypothetical protein [Lysobacter niastensis]MBF6023920.1 hypothetical protein [Lysobacter niastensis]
MNLKPRTFLLAAAISAALFTMAPGFAQDADPDAPVIAEATVPKARLVDRYTELAGGPDASADLVGDLRTGGDFVIVEEVTTTTTNPDGTTTTVTTPVEHAIVNANGPMGWGEVNITLSLAQAMVDSGAAPDLQSALAGATITNADGTVTTMPGVLQLRADGGGWGQIAKQLGFNLGSLISASNHSDKAVAGTARADKAKAERVQGKSGNDKPAKPERVAKAERPDKPEKVDRPQRPERPERPQKPERPDKPERVGRI